MNVSRDKIMCCICINIYLFIYVYMHTHRKGERRTDQEIIFLLNMLNPKMRKQLSISRAGIMITGLWSKAD